MAVLAVFAARKEACDYLAQAVLGHICDYAEGLYTHSEDWSGANLYAGGELLASAAVEPTPDGWAVLWEWAPPEQPEVAA